MHGCRRTDRRAVTGVDHLDAALERPHDTETIGVVDDAEVGDPPGSEGAPVREPEPPGSGERGHTERLLDFEAACNRLSHTIIDMPFPDKHVGVPVVGGKAAPRRRAGVHERQEVPEVFLRRPLPDHDVHSPEEFLPCLRESRALVVASRPGGDVGVQVLPGEARCVAVDHGKEIHLCPEVPVPGENAGNVHHLGKPDDPLPPPESGEVFCREHGAAHIKGRCRDTGGEHDQDVERRSRSFGEYILDSRRSADVRDLVGVGDHRRRAVRKNEPGILRRREKRTLDVDVGVDQPGHHVGPRKVVLPLPLVLPEADDVTVLHRKVRTLPDARKRVEDLTCGKDRIRRFKSPGRREQCRGQAATPRSRMTEALRSVPTKTVRKALYDPGCRSIGIVYSFSPRSR